MNGSAEQTCPIFAAFELPVHIAVESDCFGATLPVQLAGLEGFITLPDLAWVDDEPQISPPHLNQAVATTIQHRLNSPATRPEWHVWGRVTKYNPRHRSVEVAWLFAVLFRFAVDRDQIAYSDYLHGRGHPIGRVVDNLFNEIDGWFESVSEWIEVSCDQDLSRSAPLQWVTTPGGGLHVWTEDGDISLPSSANRSVIITRDVESVSLAKLQTIIQFVERGEEPTEPHRLLRDARAAHRRRRTRSAVIDAGAATEIALADFNRTVVHAPLKGRPTLGRYVENQKIREAAQLPANAMTDLVEVRNRAIHENRTPGVDVAELALKLADQIVHRLNPLPV